MNAREYFAVLKGGHGRALCAAVLLSALLGAGPAPAAITQTINYQGFLISKVTSLPVETAPDLKFLIYNTPTAGAALFTESRCNVPITKGRYDVEIGSVTAGGLPAALFSDNTGLWLEIQVDENGDCAGVYEAMSPRIKLQASPYAFSSLYASTASAATTVFLADTIGALPQTTYGAVTISSNLFVQGGISVGSISPGQKLSVAGVVESTGTWPACADPGNYTCGFKFPDGSVQVKAAALTMWDVLGINLYTINEGNTNIGGGITDPRARLHISSAAGDTGDLLLISTGTGAAQSQLFLVNGNGQVYGNSFYGDGSTLSNIVRKAGDTMTGQLTLAASSLTVTSTSGLFTPKVKFMDNVEISSAPAALRGGIRISSHVYLMPGATFYGDGSGLYNLISSDTSKVLKTGDNMTGQLTLAGSTLTVTGSAFSVGGATFAVAGGNASVGTVSQLARFTVSGGIVATSSITAQGDMYAASFNSPSGTGSFNRIRASSGTFWGWDSTTFYSVDTASGIKVWQGIVDAPYFVGNGSLLTSVTGTDATKLLKAGDTMTGNLKISGSSLTVADAGAHPYAFTVSSVPAVNRYSLVVSTGGNVGVQVLDPAAPLEVDEQILVSNPDGTASLHLKSFASYNYLRWSDSLLSINGSNQGALGYIAGTRDFVYRVMGSDPGTLGAEVFRIKSDDYADWYFGIGTASPQARFHVAANMLVGPSAASPVLLVSTPTSKVSINTATQTHALTVNGGVSAASSVTAQGGFYGGSLAVSTVTALAGSNYDGVVFTTSVYINNRLAIGGISGEPTFTPLADLHVRGTMRLDHKADEAIVLLFNGKDVGGDSYIKWDDPIAGEANKGVLGAKANDRDLVYRAGASNMEDGVETFRAKPDGRFIVGATGLDHANSPNFVPLAPFHVLSSMVISPRGYSPMLFVSTTTGSVGISTGTPKERAHIGSSFLVGGDRPAAALYVSTQSGYTGIGTGYPVVGLHSRLSFLVGTDRDTVPSLYVSTGSGYTGIGTGYPAAKLDVNGYTRVASSLTVTGTGVAGTEDVLNVKSGALLVRNDGRVGVGVAPDEMLHVNGKVKATGFSALREVQTNTCNGAATCTATCTAGRSVMGGGCSYAVGVDSMTATYPSGADTWQCNYTGATGNITAYAICSTVE